ncbi:MAG: 30S ribosome-binding factor RbfA, partial [Anaerolineales bacterium]|nr:30S ribosome-binding factor RbfA [Anaerolineales bacterium]
QHADIYVNALGDETRQKEVMQALQKATGFFRHELAQRMQVRTIPQLHFRWDPTLAHAEAVHQILENLEIPVEEAVEEAADDDE